MRTTIATRGLVLCVISLLATLTASLAVAQQPDAPAADAPAAPTFNYQTGNIVLPNKVATLHLGGNYRYLDPAETEKLLVAWGNPPGHVTQGAIVPNDVDPMTETGWAVVLTYMDDGHVDDSDAAKIDYDDLLKDMKEGTEGENAARKKDGYPPVHLLGWAEKPHYDATAKKLYWAKEFHIEGSQQNSLNYDVRVLGREGVLSMNAIAGMNQLPQIHSDMNSLIEIAEFNESYRYAQFNKKTDRTAEYGLAGLIAVGVGAKLGLFAKLWVIILAAKKAILAGLVAIGGFLARLFGKKKDASA